MVSRGRGGRLVDEKMTEKLVTTRFPRGPKRGSNGSKTRKFVENFLLPPPLPPPCTCLCRATRGLWGDVVVQLWSSRGKKFRKIFEKNSEKTWTKIGKISGKFRENFGKKFEKI